MQNFNCKALAKNRILVIYTFLLVFAGIVRAVSIDTCTSDYEDWVCDISSVCMCVISGNCTSGDLLVYRTDVKNLLCAPDIKNSLANISWDKCGPPSDQVKVVADCEGNQSAEKIINLTKSIVTTTSTTTTTQPACIYSCQSACEDDTNPPFCYQRTSHGTAGCSDGLICCESIPKGCPASITIPIKKNPCPYECCTDTKEYEFKYCRTGMICCGDNTCKESCEAPLSENFKFLLLVAMTALIPIIAFLVYVMVGKSSESFPGYE